MKHKMLYAWLMIFFFAVVSFGGCGGSSTAYFAEPEETAQGSISMKEAIDSEDIMQNIVDQIVSSDLTLAGLAEVKIYQLSVSRDGQIWMEDASFTAEESSPVLYDSGELRSHYDSEDVIILAEADIDFINKVRTDLGEVSEDSSIVGSSGYLEVYAMARIFTGNAFQNFTYSVPAMNDIIRSEGTSSQQDSSQSALDILSIDQAVTGEDEAVYTAVDFVVERWVKFFEWVSSFGMRNFFMREMLSEEIASAGKFSAADALTEEADRQDHTFDFSYTGLKADSITYDDWDKSATAFTMSRTNNLNLKVYSAHSFQTGNDYYFVQSTASTTPKNYKSTQVSPTGSASKVPYMYGYTKYLVFEAWLEGSTADNVSVAASNPGNLKPTATGGAEYTDTTSHSINSWTGVNQYKGPFAVSGVEYSNSQTWILKAWDMVNNSGANHPASAAWYADTYLPVSAWGGLIPSGGSKGTLSYTTDWVWEVKPDFWKANKTVKMNVDFEVRDGATIAETNHGRADKWFGNKQTASMTLTPPPHTSARLVGRSLSAPGNSLPLLLYNALTAPAINAETAAFSYTLDEKADTLTLKVLAEEPWTLTCKTSDGGNWAVLSSTSGTATGANGQDVTITVEENKGSRRMLYIDIQSGQDHAKVNILQNI